MPGHPWHGERKLTRPITIYSYQRERENSICNTMKQACPVRILGWIGFSPDLGKRQYSQMRSPEFIPCTYRRSRCKRYSGFDAEYCIIFGASSRMSYLAIALFALGGATVLLYLRSLVQAYRSRLAEIPGPWYGPFTSLHLNYGFSSGDIWKAVEGYHAQYGSIVRLGPRQVWVADKDALKMILVKDDLPKVATYKEFSRDRYSPGIFGEMQVFR